jgi:GGDEF domain-containing protein
MLDLMSTTFSRMTYERARRVLLGAGLLVLLITAGVMYIRRVETVEVIATLLFVPVFVGAVFWDVKGGLIAGIAAAAAYWGLRTPAIDAVGAERFSELIASRSVAYIAFGSIGGWANRQLAGSLTKLELYDQIDDETGLYNARFFVQDADLEASRAKRYRTIFSVVEVGFPADGLDGLSRRHKAALLRDLGRMLKEAVRTVDRPAHGFDGSLHRFAVVLPETGREGAAIFAERLRDRTAEFLTQRRFQLNDGDLTLRTVVYPDDEAGLEQMRGEYKQIDRSEHPEVAPA